jgi:hypothetical protein
VKPAASQQWNPARAASRARLYARFVSTGWSKKFDSVASQCNLAEGGGKNDIRIFIYADVFKWFHQPF